MKPATTVFPAIAFTLFASIGQSQGTSTDQALIEEFAGPTTDFSKAEPFEDKPGGATTLQASAANLFSQPSANLPFDLEKSFAEGRLLFNRIWVAAPARTKGSDGLGPLYNARSCQSCHINDGKGHPPQPGQVPEALLFRLSIPGPGGTSQPEPTYGAQLQSRSVDGHPPEFSLILDHQPMPFAFPDRQTVLLQRPTYGITNLGHGPLSTDVRISPRVAPPMIGLGLLEAIAEADILEWSDPGDLNGDGISGSPNWLGARPGPRMLGRFGWKAGVRDLRTQVAIALSADMGLSSPLLPDGFGDCTLRQTACRTAPDGGEGGPEVTAASLDLLTHYSRNLAVPTRRNSGSADVLRGKATFYQIGCPACHRPKFVTPRLADQPAQSFQLIWPYTDLLLHDMGDGLADNLPEGSATGREWRTAPLWGVGLTATISGRESYLHDGRARNLTEAILWHGGEAEAARAAFARLARSDREALIAFLNSL